MPDPASVATGFHQAAVVVPAHDEARNLPRTLRAVLTAAVGAPVPVAVVVVLDSCSDSSTRLAGRYGPDVHFVTVEAGNVGAARAAGFCFARSLWGESQDATTWYATTDADSKVDPDWLLRQMSADADMVLGVVRVSDWRTLSPAAIRRYLKAYHADVSAGRHNHIHGANMGFRADVYWAVGGFRALSTGEDVELVDRFEAAGYRTHWDAGLSVTTSARAKGRAPGGFAQHLRGLSESVKPSVAEDLV
ncbi:glycosyltransferase [Mycolicibacterium komossense]|uniref:4,4'-diaponeurosporenoate glycosyltransferase n=1 Tax=Mycolicibacterium komossense TaxID=1779 RepID=A0ABT3CLF2_9MYCO|nr:glycosyltransferase [Mycolicibacterium komossense]MCV7230353.1 glycosyltransferase [Mycolicibacterium komossense]